MNASPGDRDTLPDRTITPMEHHGHQEVLHPYHVQFPGHQQQQQQQQHQQQQHQQLANIPQTLQHDQHHPYQQHPMVVMSPPIAVPLPSSNSPGYDSTYSKSIQQHMDIYQSPPPPMTPNHDPSDLWSQNAVLVGRSTSVVPLNSHTSQFQQQNMLRISDPSQRSSDPSTPASSESTPSLSSTASTLHSVEGGYLGTSEGNYVVHGFKSPVPLSVGGHPTSSSSASLGSHTQTPLGMATWTNSTALSHEESMEHRGQAQAQAQAQNHPIMAHASNASQYHLQQQQQQHSSFRGSVSIDAVRSDKGPSPHPYYDQGQLLSPEQQQRQAMWIGSNMSGGLPSGSLDQERQQFRDRSSRHFKEYAHVHPATSEVGATPLFSTGAVTSSAGHHSPSTYITSGVMESRHGHPTTGGRTRGQTRHSLLLETNPYSAQGPGVEAHMSYPPASGASMMEGLPMVPPNHTPMPGTPDAHLSPGNFLTPGGLPSVGSHSYPSHHQHGHYPPHQYFQLQRSMTVPSPGSMGMEGLPQEALPEHTLNPSSSSSTSSPPPPQFPTLPSIPHQNSVWNNRPAPSRTSSAPYRISRSASDMAKNMGPGGHAQTASFSSSSSSTAPRSRTRTSSVTSSSSSASFGIVSSLSAAFGSTHLSYSDGSSPTAMSMGHGQYPRRNDYMMSPHSPLVGSGSFSMRDPRFSGGSPGDLSMSDDDPNSAARKTLAARNFTCSFPGCNKAYTQLHNLKSHERTGHTPVTKLKPFMCIISGCTKAFSQRKSLAHHIKISHQEFKFKPFKCGQPDCPKAYTQLHNLRTHEKTVHQLDLSKKRIRLPEGPREPGSFGKAMTLEQQHQQHQHQHQGGGQGFGAPPPLHFMEGQYRGFGQHNTQQGGIVGEGTFVQDMYEGGSNQGQDGKDDEYSEEGDGSHGDEEDEEDEEEEDNHGPEKPM